MTTIKYVRGDLFKDLPTDPTPNEVILIPHVCNDIGGWGSGFVLAVSKYDKLPEQMYRTYFGEDNPNTYLGQVQYNMCGMGNDNVMVANMIAQHQTIKYNKKPIRYAALVECMESVREHIEDVNIKYSIRSPKFGSALAKGTWSFIEELIQEIWCDAGIPVTIYEY